MKSSLALGFTGLVVCGASVTEAVVVVVVSGVDVVEVVVVVCC